MVSFSKSPALSNKINSSYPPLLILHAPPDHPLPPPIQLSSSPPTPISLLSWASGSLCSQDAEREECEALVRESCSGSSPEIAGRQGSATPSQTSGVSWEPTWRSPLVTSHACTHSLRRSTCLSSRYCCEPWYLVFNQGLVDQMSEDAGFDWLRAPLSNVLGRL